MGISHPGTDHRQPIVVGGFCNSRCRYEDRTGKVMKAVLQQEFGAADVLHLSEAEDPSPGPGQVLVEVVSTSVNRPDIIQRQGNYPPPKGESTILGLEVAGVVAAVGEGVTRWRKDDRVMGLIGGGAYAELALAWEGQPRNKSFI